MRFARGKEESRMTPRFLARATGWLADHFLKEQWGRSKFGIERGNQEFDLTCQGSVGESSR